MLWCVSIGNQARGHQLELRNMNVGEGTKFQGCSDGETCANTPGNAVLFDDAPLKLLDLSRCQFSERGQGYPHPGSNGLVTRPLEREDYSKGYLSLLSQLTKVGEYDRDTYNAQFDRMKALPEMYYVVVIEDVSLRRVIASATLVMELKFIHNAACRGRIEELVVDAEYRNLHLGSYLLELLTVLSREIGAYKITLDCKEHLEGFYRKYGYVNEGQLYLSQRFHE